MISPAGVLGVLPRVRRLKLGPAMAGQVARVWTDEVTVHVTVGGQLVKTVPSSRIGGSMASRTRVRFQRSTVPEPVDLEQHRVRRHPRVGGMINEYRLVV